MTCTKPCDKAADGRCRSGQRPLAAYARLLSAQLAMCDNLEAIADALPHHVDKRLCRGTAHQLTTILIPAHRLEEDIILPRLRQSAAGFAALSEPTFVRLGKEHQLDAGYAIEVCELLDTLANNSAPINLNAMGYAFRSFFECLRRHVQFDLEVIVPICEEALLPSDLDKIARELDVLQFELSFTELTSTLQPTSRQLH